MSALVKKIIIAISFDAFLAIMFIALRETFPEWDWLNVPNFVVVEVLICAVEAIAIVASDKVK